MRKERTMKKLPLSLFALALACLPLGSLATANKPKTAKPTPKASTPAKGTLHKNTIQSAIRTNQHHFRQCYENALKKQPKLKGRVVVSFVIAASGKVSNASIKSSTLGHKGVEACLQTHIAAIQFPKPQGGGIVRVNYPLNFAPSLPAPPTVAAAKAAPKAPSGSLLHDILKSRTLRVCVRADIPPFGYFRGQRLSGFDVSLAKEISTHLSIRYRTSLRIQWVIIRAPERISSLQQDQCDFVVAAFSKTAARAKLVAFSNVYFQTRKVLISKRFGASTDSPVLALIRSATPGSVKLKNPIISFFRSYNDILYTMHKQLVDHVVTDQPTGLYLVRQSNNAYKIDQILTGQEHYAIGINKKHSHLRDEINRCLQSLTSSGRLAFLLRKWVD